MSKKKKTPQHEEYSKMADTPWITQARQIADIGGQGVLDNYNKVNTFDESTLASLEARNNATYKRAFDNMEREYTNTMNKYAANNYNRFGTLNATAPSYTTDEYQRQFQREMDDLAYNQAVNYDTLMDNELNRRYNTLNMYNSMYQYGETPYELDVRNWNIDNANKDVRYNNAMTNYLNSSSGSRSGFSWNGAAKGAASGASTGTAISPGWGTAIGAVAGGVAGGFGYM